ncbi:MAG TPA: helix-turn-helix transcriptional regulator [Acetobacteraceae bacterium]|nr:helix-turn-helix transcriptional regulator [Acetobacteraceae bacterium]
MRTPADLSLEALSRLIDDTHAAGVSGNDWLGAVERISRLSNSQSATLFTQDAVGEFEKIGPESALEALDRMSRGALIVDAEARLAHANRAAQVMLSRADGLGIEWDGGARRLRAANQEQTLTLRRLIWQAAMPRHDATFNGGGVLRLASETGALLLASVSPLRAGLAWNATRHPAALVLLSAPDQDTAPAPEHLRALFGLTPAEAAVAGRIMRGDGIKAAARALGIAPNTVRTHLSRIFEKTETHRQAELVRLLQQVARLSAP